jgi:hypothetical protein
LGEPSQSPDAGIAGVDPRLADLVGDETAAIPTRPVAGAYAQAIAWTMAPMTSEMTIPHTTTAAV